MDKKLYFAPMEGIVGYVYRNAHRAHFHGIDCYYTPFLAPNQNRKWTPKERKEVDPELNGEVPLVPQILTNKPQDFIWAAREMQLRGYKQVNLNLGCPSGTVVSKGRGAGFLGNPEQLDLFFDEIFQEVEIAVSIKTRIGLEDAGELETLQEIFEKYPFCEWILHPRLRSEFYKGMPNMEAFDWAYNHTNLPICYNGNVFTVQQAGEIKETYPDVSAIMMGRGMLYNPGLADEIKTGCKLDKEKLQAFYNSLYEGYRQHMQGDNNILFKMKEVWTYMSDLFENGEKLCKKIRKAQNLKDYEAVVNDAFRDR